MPAVPVTLSPWRRGPGAARSARAGGRSASPWAKRGTGWPRANTASAKDGSFWSCAVAAERAEVRRSGEDPARGNDGDASPSIGDCGAGADDALSPDLKGAPND